MLFTEAQARWNSHKGELEARGIIFPDVVSYTTPEMKRDWRIAMDAVPTTTTTANASIPAILTSFLDLEPIRVAFAPIEATTIAEEKKMGTWLDDVSYFNIIESTGETSAYGDFNENGASGINQNFPQRQSFHFQVMEEYGERQLERAGLTKINYVSEVNAASADNLNRFGNFGYFFGISNLQNYGIINDPLLGTSLTPGTKANGNGNVWVTSTGVINATANEALTDFQAMIWQLKTNSGGLIKDNDEFVVGCSPGTSIILTATNSFGITLKELLKQVFPNMTFVEAVQYGKVTSANPQGIAGGNLVQIIAKKFNGKQSVFTAFTEKMRAHKLIPATSSFKRKVTQGIWGAVWRYPVAETSMLGV